MFGTDGLEAVEEPRRRRFVAALAEHRLDDDRRGLGRGRLAEQQVSYGFERRVDAVVECARAERTGERRDEHPRWQRAVTGPVDGLRRGHRHGEVGATVERPLEHDHVGPSGRLLGQLHRRLGRLGAGVGEEEGVDAGGGDVVERVGQLAQERVGVAVGLGVDEPRRLGLDRGDDRRVAVTGAGDGDAGGEVEVPVAVAGRDPATLTRHDIEIGDLVPNRGKMRHPTSVARIPCQGGHAGGFRRSRPTPAPPA